MSRRMLTPPFFFPGTQITFVFCEGHLNAALPGGIVLMRPNVVLVAFARFTDAYSLDFRDRSFSYLETSFFLPVRYRVSFGLLPVHIFPSTELPVTLGSEFYGFPKQCAPQQETERSMTLTAEDGHLTLENGHYSHPVSEAELVGTMGAWYGVPRQLTIPAFRLGDGLLSALGVPLLRNIGVYNLRTLPDSAAGQLTYACFNVMRWHSISQLDKPTLTASGDFFGGMSLVIKKAYRTTLDMFLSRGVPLRRGIL
jgi:hypothetical protein